MNIYAKVTSSIVVDFPLMINGDEAKAILDSNNKINEDKLNAYLKTIAAKNGYSEENDFSYKSIACCYNSENYENSLITNLSASLCYNGTQILNDNENMGIALVSALRNAAEEFVKKISADNYRDIADLVFSEVLNTTVDITDEEYEIQGVKNFRDELALENGFDKFVDDTYKNYRLTNNVNALNILAAQGFEGRLHNDNCISVTLSDTDYEAFLRLGLLYYKDFDAKCNKHEEDPKNDSAYWQIYNIFANTPTELLKMIKDISDSLSNEDIDKLPYSVRSKVTCYREFEEAEKIIENTSKTQNNTNKSKPTIERD